jgi:hypothetical protein
MAYNIDVAARVEDIGRGCRATLRENYKRITNNAYDVAMEHFTAEAMCKRWADYLDLVVTGGPTPNGLYEGA